MSAKSRYIHIELLERTYNMSKLTIIVTYYNSEEYIKSCIESIKQQRTQDFEVIIVNDGSTDNSEQLMNEALKD